MILSDDDKKMRDGHYGPGARKAIGFMIDYGEAFDAARLVPVHSAHILQDPLEMLEELMDGVSGLRTRTSLHSVSPLGGPWSEALGLSDEDTGPVVESSVRAMDIYKDKGCLMTMTCAPYLMGNVLRKDQVFSWAGSSGIIINNSLFGARGNRDSGLAMTASAITGRTPEIGRIRDDGRVGEILFRFQKVAVDRLSEAELGAVGYHIGALAQTKNVVVDGLPPDLPFEKLKYFLSPMPVSGAVSLCHIVGVTPEAPDVDSAFRNRKPEHILTIRPSDIREAARLLADYHDPEVDMVLMGCPHLTIGEIRDAALMLEGKRVSSHTRLVLSTNEGVYHLARRMGYLNILDRAGARVVTDSCMAVFPFARMKETVRRVATNSARCAHYMLRGGAGEVMGGKVMETYYGDAATCIRAAITGTWEER
ncbi:aconitase X catalytic domain-containing protein [Desulfatiferula olefinivorans]